LDDALNFNSGNVAYME